MEEKLELLHEIDFKKKFIDKLEDTHLPIYFPGFTDSAYLLMIELEETFYFPPKYHYNDFQIWKVGPLGYLRFPGISKEDGTKTTALWRMGQLFPFPEPILFLIKKSPELKKRLDFIFNKHKTKFNNALDGPNKDFFKKRNNSRRIPIDSKLRHEVFKRDCYKCVECGITNKKSVLHVDHIIPISRGGKDELDNLQTLCENCNLSKSDKLWKGGNSK